MVTSALGGHGEQIVQDALKALNEDGFAVISGWIPQDRAKELCDLIDAWIDGNPDRVQRNADDRVFGAEHLSPTIAAYKHDGVLERIAATYMGREQKALFTMGNRLRSVEGESKRSGGRWHRDRKARQFKSLVYLTDCKRENGSFCIVRRSANAELFTDAIASTRFDFPNQRWDDSHIDPFLAQVGSDVVPIEGAAGTLVLFDSSLIHSGLPIRMGQRYALTNYYYAAGEIDLPKVRSKFAPAVQPLEMPQFAHAS